MVEIGPIEETTTKKWLRFGVGYFVRKFMDSGGVAGEVIQS